MLVEVYRDGVGRTLQLKNIHAFPNHGQIYFVDETFSALEDEQK